MREDVARVGLHGDFLELAELLRDALEHRLPPGSDRRTIRGLPG
jgi:hypothetical protein